MSNPLGARKCDSFKAVSTAPSINKTPVGNSTAPLPYPTVADLSNSVNTVASVRFNGKPAYVLDRTTQPTCKGDAAGSCGGVRSGTVGGEVRPVTGSSTVRIGGKPVVREGDRCTMNGGNNPGIYITVPAPSGGIVGGRPDRDNDPPIEAETPQEQGWLAKWWEKTKLEVSEAVDHPWEATKGALKGVANVPADVVEALMKGSALRSAGEMDQAAAIQGFSGQTQSAEALRQAAQEVRAGANAIELPKFKMTNPAQAGGDKVVTAAGLLAGGAGLAKGGVRAASAVSKTAAVAGEGAEAVKGAASANRAIQAERAARAESAVAEARKAADATADAGRAARTEGAETGRGAGDGVKVVKKESLRPGTAAHKADRWQKYQERGGAKSFDEWSKQYDTNMRNYQFGAAREAEYRSAMDATQGTVRTPLTNRQIDVLKKEEMYAGQLKTGPVSLTKENAVAIQKDAELVKQGWTVEHILEKGASKPYLDALARGGIQHKIGRQIP